MGIVTAGLALAGAASQAYAADRAASAQRRGAKKAREAQAEALRQQRETMAPYLQSGQTSQNELLRLLGLGAGVGSEGYGSMAQPFGMEQFEADPGYQFRMDEGMKALERSAAARGGLLSGGFLKGATRYGQGLASQEYMNAFNRYQAERQARLNPLFSLYQSGQNAANALAGYQGGYGQGAAQSYMNAADARASNYLTQGSIFNNLFSQAQDAYSGMNRFDPNLAEYQVQNAWSQFNPKG